MDTDELTPMAYQTLSKAFEVADVLRAEIGVSASKFKTEDDFLHGTLRFLDEILEAPDEYLDSWNLLDDLEVKLFSKGVKDLQCHIRKTLATARSRRGKPPFDK